MLNPRGGKLQKHGYYDKKGGLMRFDDEQIDALLQLYNVVIANERLFKGVLPGATSMMPPAPPILVPPIEEILAAAQNVRRAKSKS
jgi:hypothetical protein